MRADLENLALDVVKDHFAAAGEAEYTWEFAGGGTASFRATTRNGLPQSPFESPSAVTIHLKPADMPANGERGDTVVEAATGQRYRVVEPVRRRSSQTVITLEKVK